MAASGPYIAACLVQLDTCPNNLGFEASNSPFWTPSFSLRLPEGWRRWSVWLLPPLMLGSAELFAGVLCPAMAALTMEAAPTVWNSSALGTAASGSNLGLNFAGAPSTLEVRIQGKPTLIDAVKMLFGTGPVYTSEKINTSMFRSCVRFGLPLDKEKTSFKNIAVIGMICSTVLEAESEASIAALQELQSGDLSMCVMGVSCKRCKDLEQECYKILARACEVYHGIKLALANWEEEMHKADDQYKAPEKHRNITPDVAEQLFKVTRASHLKHQELANSAEKLKDHIDRVYGRIEDFFRDLSIHQVNEHRGNLPHVMKISMQFVLEQLVSSLGWSGFSYNTSSLGTTIYTCETTIFLDHGPQGAAPRTLTFFGPEALTKEQAIESSCEAAILALEHDKSMCLVDLNYHSRSLGELYVVETEGAMQFASSITSRVLSAWQVMADEMYECEEYCQKVLTDHLEDQSTHGQKSRCLYAVAGLRNACLNDLQLAKQLLMNAGAWI